MPSVGVEPGPHWLEAKLSPLRRRCVQELVSRHQELIISRSRGFSAKLHLPCGLVQLECKSSQAYSVGYHFLDYFDEKYRSERHGRSL